MREAEAVLIGATWKAEVEGWVEIARAWLLPHLLLAVMMERADSPTSAFPL